MNMNVVVRQKAQAAGAHKLLAQAGAEALEAGVFVGQGIEGRAGEGHGLLTHALELHPRPRQGCHVRSCPESVSRILLDSILARESSGSGRTWNARSLRGILVRLRAAKRASENLEVASLVPELVLP